MHLKIFSFHIIAYLTNLLNGTTNQNESTFFKIEYENEFQGIKKSKKSDEYAYCVPCKVDICLTATGKTAISIHQQSDKHNY